MLTKVFTWSHDRYQYSEVRHASKHWEMKYKTNLMYISQRIKCVIKNFKSSATAKK